MFSCKVSGDLEWVGNQVEGIVVQRAKGLLCERVRRRGLTKLDKQKGRGK
jgi:hypothetical protein